MSGDFVRGLSLSAKYDLLDFLPTKAADSTEGDSSQGNGRESGHTSSASSSAGSRSSESLAPQGSMQLQIQELFGGKKKRDSKELTSRSGRSSNAKSNKCRRSKVESALTNAIKNAGDDGRVNSIPEGPWASSHSEWGEYVDVEDNAGTSHEGTPPRTIESQTALNAQLYESSTRESQSKADVDEEIARISAAATSKWNSVALKKRDRYAVAGNAQDETLDTAQTILSSAVYETRSRDGSKTVPLETSPHRTKPTGSTRQGSPCVRVERMVLTGNGTGLDELSSKVHGEDYRYSTASSSGSRTGHYRGVAPGEALLTQTSEATATRKNSTSQGGRLFGKNLGDSKNPPKIVEGKTHSVVKPVPFRAPTVSVHPSHGTVAEAGLTLSTHSDPGNAQSPRRSFYAEDGMIFDLELDDGTTSHSK